MSSGSSRPRMPGYFFRQLLWASLTVLVPALALLAWLQLSSLATALDALKNAGIAQAGESAKQTDQALGRIAHVLDFLTSRDEVRQLRTAECNTLLAGYAGSALLLNNVAVFDTQGNLVCAARPDPALAEGGPRQPWYREAAAAPGRWLSSPYVRTSETDAGLIAITQPILTDAGEIKGLAALLVDTQRLSQALLQPRGLPEGSIISIIDADWRIVSRSHGAQKFFGTQVRQQGSSLLYLPDPVPVFHGIDGVMRVRTVLPLTNANWRLFVGIPVAGQLATAKDFALRGLLVLIGSAFLGFVVAHYNARRLARPTQHIAQVIHRLGEGDFAARANDELPGEFGTVAQELNGMADALQQLEGARLETRQAREESQAKTVFLARLSHELRSPLQSLLADARALQEGSATADPAQREHAQRLQATGELLSALTEDALDLARIEAGQLAVSFGSVSARDVVQAAVRLSTLHAASVGVKVQLMPLKQTLPQVRTDATRLQQLLLNLVRHAVTGSRPGDLVRIDVSSDGLEVEVTITDSGLGSSVGAAARTSSSLTLAHQLVKVLGFRLHVSATATTGTRMVLTIPARMFSGLHQAEPGSIPTPT